MGKPQNTSMILNVPGSTIFIQRKAKELGEEDQKTKGKEREEKMNKNLIIELF